MPLSEAREVLAVALPVQQVRDRGGMALVTVAGLVASLVVGLVLSAVVDTMIRENDVRYMHDL